MGRVQLASVQTVERSVGVSPAVWAFWFKYAYDEKISPAPGAV